MQSPALGTRIVHAIQRVLGDCAVVDHETRARPGVQWWLPAILLSLILLEGDQMQGSIKGPLLTHCQYSQYQWDERVARGEGKLGPPRKARHICI